VSITRRRRRKGPASWPLVSRYRGCVVRGIEDQAPDHGSRRVGDGLLRFPSSGPRP
jgi:hypothetical protein